MSSLAAPFCLPPATPGPEARLFAYLDSLSISYETFWHRPVFTVEEGLDIEEHLPAVGCKNLFLKSKTGDLWLVVMPGALRANLGALEKRLDSGRLSFGKPDLMQEILDITPGSVTPFALINDIERRVRVVLDESMMAAPHVAYHPLRNDASVVLDPKDLLKFINSLGYSPRVANCAAPPKD